ncbi:unnamed protein product [Prunus armeniaca]|uniref:Protein EARLY FLOWERING 4 domain-containing protein n=1 Tax=Prunus armeniaca TaxID=36596 RepID=A0A6J5U7E3_PRUAR|nr:unnamed protein product [Prunus armeniaca]
MENPLFALAFGSSKLSTYVYQKTLPCYQPGYCYFRVWGVFSAKFRINTKLFSAIELWLTYTLVPDSGKQGIGNGTQLDTKVVQTFQKSFVQVQDILDQNRLLINEINQNHESKIPDNLSRNVGLIRELNSNIRRVVDLYADLSSSFSRSMEASSEAESGGTLKSDGKSSEKRIRSG